MTETRSGQGSGIQGSKGQGTGFGSPQGGRDLARQRPMGARGQQDLGRWGGWSPMALSPLDLLTVSPFELFRRMSQEINQVSGAGAGTGISSAGALGVFIPPVEIQEREGKLLVTADLPGLSKDDVRVEITNEGLVLEGERREEHEERVGGIYRTERAYGSFRRVIPLPEEVKADQAEASFDNGVLEIRIPLARESSSRRQIPVQTNQGRK